MPGRRFLGPGAVFGEVAFFTEVSQHEGVRSTTVCRVLTIPRDAYQAMTAAFPIGARSVLENLRTRTQEVRRVDSSGVRVIKAVWAARRLTHTHRFATATSVGRTSNAPTYPTLTPVPGDKSHD